MSGLNNNDDDLQGKNIILINNTEAVGVQGSSQKIGDNFDGESVSSNMDTLDESVYDTLTRDFIRMVHKCEYVLIPRTTAMETKQLRNCI